MKVFTISRPGIRLNDNLDLKFSSVGQCLMFVFGWAHSCELALTVCEVCELRTIFFSFFITVNTRDRVDVSS